MKVAIYIEDGVTQLVLTPQGDFEADAVRWIDKGKTQAEIHRGEFYKCEGGWDRSGAEHNSIILRFIPTKTI